MYSSEDLERFYFQYQTEAKPNGISIEQFCSRNKVPYNIFYKWYKDTRGKLVEVKVDGLPGSAHEEPRQAESSASATSPVRMLVCQKLRAYKGYATNKELTTKEMKILLFCTIKSLYSRINRNGGNDGAYKKEY